MSGSLYASLRASILAAALLLASSILVVITTIIFGRAGVFDRGVIAFISECASRTEDLYQLDIAHQTRMLLSSRYDRIYSLSYSPQASWLVFEAAEDDEMSMRRVYAIDLETHDEYTLASDYITFNGTPMNWRPDGKYLELRMMGGVGTGIGMENIVVDVSNGEVISTLPMENAFATLETGPGDRLSGTIIMPIFDFDSAYTMNNRVDVDTSRYGDVVRSRRSGFAFDLYVRFAGSNQFVQVTHDNCIERYPRWQP
jgi:hypothetical protein